MKLVFKKKKIPSFALMVKFCSEDKEVIGREDN